jgi:hypothetical protein
MILGEVAPYIFTIVVFLGLAVSRWKRHRDKRKSAKKDAQDAVEEQMLEMEFAAQMGELEEKLVIEQPSVPEDSKEEGWWSDQSDLV